MKTYILRALAVASAAFTFGSPVLAQGAVVDDTFGGYGLTWGNNVGQTLIRYRPVIIDGEMHICGVISNRGGSRVNRLGRDVLRDAKIEMNDQLVFSDLSYFNMVSHANMSNDLVGTTASCEGTGLSPSESDLSTLAIRIRDGRYTYRR